MVKLRKLRIEGFRGATNALPLDFTSGYQSVAVLGENAGGKSTITDALEWYFTNRVDHLWREDCKEEALRNVQIGDTQNSVVAIDFSEPDLSDVKELSPEYRIDRTNKTAGLVQYLQDSASEQLWLRSSDLTNFIIKTKNDKRDYIADIIGYDQILNFRNVIQSTLNSLQREDSYVAAKQNFDTSQARSLKISGTIISTELQLYNKVIELIKPYKISISITDDSSFEDCIDILKGQATDTQKTEKRI